MYIFGIGSPFKVGTLRYMREIRPEEIYMQRIQLEHLVADMLWEAKRKYATWGRVAEELGVAPKSLRRYISGEYLPSLEVYSALCECIGRRCCSDECPDDDGDFYIPASLWDRCVPCFCFSAAI